MKEIHFDPSPSMDFIQSEELEQIKPEVLSARESLLAGTGSGNDCLGWIDLPINYDREEFASIKQSAEKIRKDSDVLVVIGIGGSYLGARAAIEFLSPHFYNQLRSSGQVEIYFAGNSLSGDYIRDLIQVIGERDFSINVISKSGTTTEPAIAFRIFKKMLVEKYGEEEAAKRIYATTDKVKGALKTQADALGYSTFVVPDDIGGRYSVLTAVGLLPMAVAGIDISALMAGAQAMRERVLESDFEDNPALLYAAYRNLFFRQGKSVEMLASYSPDLHMVAEWWKQLYGESEGKGHKGLFPAAYDLSTDLHSIGQFIQDGPRIMFETVLDVERSRSQIIMIEEEEDLDGLNYLSGKDLDHVNRCAMEGTMKAHIAGGVPNLVIHLPDHSPETLGQLFYFFEFACGVSGYVLGVNPFDQPGVEAYKHNMFTLLGKPGYGLGDV